MREGPEIEVATRETGNFGAAYAREGGTLGTLTREGEGGL
jgi:hypothetical protein